MHNAEHSRASAALWGLAIGDALGMPTQSLSPADIRRHYGEITGLVAADPEQPIAPSLAAGSVTDDTEQALLLAAEVLRGSGSVNPHRFAAALLDWEKQMLARGSRDLLGPSTKAALSALADGVPLTEAGRGGITNGAAMRITPVALAHAPGAGLSEAVWQASVATHNTFPGLAAAQAVATVISAGVSGAEFTVALRRGLAAAERTETAITAGSLGSRQQGASLGTPGSATAGEQQVAAPAWVAGAGISAKCTALLPLARPLSDSAFRRFVRGVVGTSVLATESVVAALLIADRYCAAPLKALRCAANLGGDTDTIAALVGAMLGAQHGIDGWPRDLRERLCAANPHLPELGHLSVLTHRLLALRQE